MRAKRFFAAVVVLGLTVMIAAPAAAKKAPKAGSATSALAHLSPLGDFVDFSAAVGSKTRGCTLRTVQIRRPVGNVLLETIRMAGPRKSGQLWGSRGDSEFHGVEGYVTPGEELLAFIPQKKLKKRGQVIAICKPARKKFFVPFN